MAAISRHLTAENIKSSPGMFDRLHPQTISFFKLFPQPDGTISLNTILAQQFQQLWTENFEGQHGSLLGFSAIKPGFDDQSAEKGGNDFACRINVHYKIGNEEKSFYIDDIPYPNNDGEFVINGNRYFIPMLLRDARQQESMKLTKTYYNDLRNIKRGKNPQDDDKYEGNTDDLEAALLKKLRKDKKSLAKHERPTDELRVILLDELLQDSLKNIIEKKFRVFRKDADKIDIRKQHIALNEELLHPFIMKYGRLIDKENPLSRLSQLRELSFYGFQGGLHRFPEKDDMA